MRGGGGGVEEQFMRLPWSAGVCVWDREGGCCMDVCVCLRGRGCIDCVRGVVVAYGCGWEGWWWWCMDVCEVVVVVYGRMRGVVVYGCVCVRGGGGVWTCVRGVVVYGCVWEGWWWCMDVCERGGGWMCVVVVVYGCERGGGVWMCVRVGWWCMDVCVCVCERVGGGIWMCVWEGWWWCMDVCVRGVVVVYSVCEVVYGCVCERGGGVWMCVRVGGGVWMCVCMDVCVRGGGVWMCVRGGGGVWMCVCERGGSGGVWMCVWERWCMDVWGWWGVWTCVWEVVVYGCVWEWW